MKLIDFFRNSLAVREAQINEADRKPNDNSAADIFNIAQDLRAPSADIPRFIRHPEISYNTREYWIILEQPSPRQEVAGRRNLNFQQSQITVWKILAVS